MAVFNGTSGNDILSGSIDADTLNGGGGNDQLFGGTGNDVLTTVDVLGGDAGNTTEFVSYSNTVNGATALATALTQPNSGVSIVSASYTGEEKASSFFSSFSYGLGQLGAGILLTSGSGTPALTNTSTGFSVNNGKPGDALLDGTIAPVFPGKPTFDATVLTIEFTLTDKTATQVSLDMVFGSEEYPEYADSFVDVAAIYVDDVNYAYFNNGSPLSVLKNNFGEIVDNSSKIFPIEYDGISDVLKFSGNLAATADGHHTIRISIADIGDGILDSGLFVTNLNASAGAAGIRSVIDDFLDGGVGADSMAGGYGGDTYVVDDAGDVVTEQLNQGVDTVKSSISYVVGNNVENLTLTGLNDITGTGNSLDNVITGNNGKNTLSGGSGNDTYIFNVGGGQDTIDNYDATGLSIDKLVFGIGINPADLEFRNDPNDGPSDLLIRVKGTADSVRILNYFTDDNYRLDTFQFANGVVWNKSTIANTPVVIGSYIIMGDEKDNLLIGSEDDDSIVALEGNDTLQGGNGKDTMNGGQGNDTYVVESVSDIVIERSESAFSIARLNTTASGGQALGGASTNVRFSPDGTRILFESMASNLVDGDTNALNDLFVKNINTGLITRINTKSDGVQASGGDSGHAMFSLDGTKVVFRSEATNLVDDDTNAKADIFVKNLTTGVLTRVNTSATGVQADDASTDASLSADGNKVVFASYATNLVTGDTNAASDIFLKDLKTGTVTRLDTNSAGVESNGNSFMPLLSSDGSRVIFASEASNLVANDSNEKQDIFIKNIVTQETTRVNVTANGTEANGHSYDAVLSASGTKVLFASDASNLVVGDTNDARDLFVKDLITGVITRVSTNDLGVEANAASYNGQFSADGLQVVFVSSANNLVAGDNNGLRDVFVKNLATGLVTRASTASDGVGGNAVSAGNVSFSKDGNQVAFESSANNLITGDSNLSTDIFIANLAYSNGGIDTVQSSISYTLTANVDNLILTGTAPLSGTGNTLANQITGNNGDNELTGGAGNDTLSGGLGTDSAVYALSWANYDVVGDATHATVTARTGTEGTDTLNGIESLTFNGVIVSLVDTVNDAPIAMADTNTSDVVIEAAVAIIGDASAMGNVLTNDTDADTALGLGETSVVSAVNGHAADVGVSVLGNYGSVMINADGSYRYTLDDADTDTQALTDGQSVSDVFHYTVVDAHGLTATTTLTIQISGSNDTPIGAATAVLVAGAENSQYIINTSELLQGFSDVDSNVLSVVNLVADQGLITANQNGTYTLTPTANYHGVVNLTYGVQDALGATVAASQHFALFASTNHVPMGVATAVLNAGTEDVSYVVSASDLLQGFSDADGDTLVITTLQASQGTVVNNHNGTYTITQLANVNGNVSLSYNVIDNNGGIVAATQSFSMTSVNDAPTGSATALLPTGVEDVGITVAASDLLQGFSDVDGTLHVGQLTATHATVVNNQNGTYSLAPASNYHGVIELAYNVIDNEGASISATQQINVIGVNDAPVGVATTILAAATENKDYLIRANDLLQGFSDVDGDVLTTTNVAVNQGVITQNIDGSYTITPPVDYVGTIMLSYQVVDGLGGSIAASQQIDVLSAANHTPMGTATAILAMGMEDTAYVVSANDLLQGFSSVDGSVLSVSDLMSAQGSVTDNQNGTYTILPTANYNGKVTLNYNVVNPLGGSLAATQSVTLSAVNDAPTGIATVVLAAGTEDVSYVVSASDLLQGFSDVDGDTLMVSQLTASQGVIINNQNGTYTITPTANYNGTVALSYNVVDGHGGSIAASRQLTVNAVNDAPTGIATATLAAGTEDTAYIVNASDLLQGFSDVEANALMVSGLTASRGVVVNNQNGTYTITPEANYSGTLMLSYQVVDGNGGSVVAKQSVQLVSANDAPIGAPTGSLVAAIENKDYVLSASQLLLGFSDPDNEAIAVTNLSSDLGTLKDNADGTYTITPPSNYNGMIQLNYTVTDGKGGSVAAVQHLSVIVVTQMLVGSTAADTLQGGGGNDTYVVNHLGDVVVELNNPSIDTVQASVDYALTANVEHLTLTGTDNINGMGNSLNNNIKGNDGNNRLEGGDGNDMLWGGKGADTLVGGQGNDTYYVDDANDIVVEALTTNYEFDTIYSAVDYTLSANVERLILQGTANLNGTGNADNNTLEGNSGANSLVGGAGDDRLDGMMGADTMEGGLGSDLYTVDNVADVVTELADEGIDFVNSSVSYSLNANVERLFLTGTANLSGTGNVLHNTVYGNSGDNVLNGGAGNDTLNGQAGNDSLDGGLGNDNLKGGLGNDSYLFGLNAGQDTIDNTDAGNGNDRVLFDVGVAADQVWLRQVASSLEVSIIGTNDRLLISDWYTNPAKQVDSFELSNGEVLLAADVQTLVTAMAAFAPPTLGQTSLNGAQHTALDNVIAVSW